MDTIESMQLADSLTQDERQEMQRLNRRYGKRPKQLIRGYKQLCSQIIRRIELEKALKEWEEMEEEEV
jgi:hypothetical protein